MQLKIKAIPGYQYYYADTDGNIYSVTPEKPQAFFDLAKLQLTETSPGKFHHPQTGNIDIIKLKPFKDTNGYMQVSVGTPGRRSKQFVHKLILLTFKGPFPKGMETNHKDLNPKNNKLSNLEFMTPAQNMQHAAAARRKEKNYDITKTRPGDPF